LTKYFLNDIHHFHINPKNIYGTKGRLAMSFGGLVQNIFTGNQKHVAPWEIKKVVAMKANQFAGFAQHDS
jgi:ubiquitin C-terminal hydrolase